MSRAIAREVEHHMAEAAADAAVLLDEARKAWRDRQVAKDNLARLRNYRRRTPAMQDDMDASAKKLCAAEDTLKRVLGQAA